MKRLFLSLFCASMLYSGYAYSQGALTAPQPPSASAPTVSATQAQSPLEAAAQAAVTAAVAAAKQNLMANLPLLSPSVIAQLLALQALFGSLLSGLQKLFASLSVPKPSSATPTAAGAPVPVAKPSVWNKLAGYALLVVKAMGMNL